jgi:ferric-dicitrate binding protein FerR (iron transport regulator)
MDYTNYNIEDFLTDESFTNYCYDLNDSDKAHWENVILTQPLLKKKIGDARELCLLLGVRVSQADKQKELAKLKAAISGEKLKDMPVAKVRRMWIPGLAIAATLLVLAISYGLYKLNAPVSGAVLYSRVNTSTYHMVAQTEYSSRKVVVLPDGSQVTLNGSSTLQVANDYGQSDRHVMLVGEAFFEVKKDKTRPFVVLTNKTATTALGTSFKVSSYATSKMASVMLSTGKVKVEATQPKSNISDQVLIPGQQIVLNDGEHYFKRSGFDRNEIKNWLDTKIEFSNASFREIAEKINYIYGVHLTADDKAANKIMFTGRFGNKSLTEVLDAIGFVNNFTYTHQGDAIKIVLNPSL